jgi:hypothetical protein
MGMICVTMLVMMQLHPRPPHTQVRKKLNQCSDNMIDQRGTHLFRWVSILQELPSTYNCEFAKWSVGGGRRYLIPCDALPADASDIGGPG